MVASLGSVSLLGGCASGGGGHAEVAREDRIRLVPDPPSGVALSTSDDDLPADLGAPLIGMPIQNEVRKLSIEAPIGSIAARPDGRAVLDRDLPGLCERPEFGMFKSLSLKSLASMSHGRITRSKLHQLQDDLVKVQTSDAQ